MANSIKLLIIACFGLFYLSCKEDKNKTIVPVQEQTVITPKQEKTVDKPEYDHYNTNGLEWASFEDMIKSDQSGSKKYIIDIYTEWCQWCKIMDKKTFADEEIQSLMRENFHTAKFNAESQSDIQFKGVPYEWKSDGRKGINELAAELMKGQISYPTIVFMDEEMKVIRVSRGYKNPQQFREELEIILRS